MHHLWLLNSALAAGAPAAVAHITAARSQATPVTTPTASCTTTVVNPTPTASICGTSGTIADLSLLFRHRIPTSTYIDRLESCVELCLGQDNGCQSLSYDSDLRICTTYFKSLADQGFASGPSSPDLNLTYYDRGCFGSNCLIRSPMPLPSHVPESICSAVFKERTPAGANCDEYIQSLQSPDVIGSAPFEKCPLACLNRPECKSFLFNNTQLSCTLYGETIEQQNPVPSKSFNPDASYLDKTCWRKECTACFPPEPTTTFVGAPTAQTCIPAITTQLVQNPSFEDSGDASPWLLSSGVTLITNDPSSAYQGSSYVQLISDQQSPNPSINQTLQALNAGSVYRLQLALRHAKIDDTLPCYLTVYSDGKQAGQSSFKHLPDTVDTSTIYRLNYATFISASSTADISIELSCSRNDGPVTAYIDDVNVIPADPQCSFQLQVGGSDPHYGGLYISSTPSYDSDQFALVNNRSEAKAFGLDGFGFLVEPGATYYYLNQPLPIEDGMYYANLGTYGGYGQILCQIGSSQSLQCSNALQKSDTFRWCSNCQLGEILYQMNFVQKDNPYFDVCQELDLQAIFN